MNLRFSPALLFALAFPALSLLQAADPVSFQVGSFSFVRPEGWTWVNPTSTMRKAELSVPGEPEAAEVTFFHFGAGQGGSVDANLQRWLGQFSGSVEELDALQAKQEISGTTVHLIQAKGTFLSGMPGQPTTPKEGFALRGAILESTSGDVYVKMTGPAAVVSGAADAFDRLVLDAAAASGAAKE